jgi:hypothetical protein
LERRGVANVAARLYVYNFSEQQYPNNKVFL